MILELFSCSGGLAEGLRRAGLRPDLAIDYDADACDSYEANHGHRPIQMDVRDLARLVRAGWSPGEPIDLLVADPPCTPWSRAGKRLGTADERDMLVETVDVISALRPSAYLVANVPGLDDSTNWHVVQEHIGGLARHGYCVADFRSLDAADFGVPQHRRRPFWFGHRGGPCLIWPEPTHGDPELASTPTLPGMAALRPWVTVREALAHLPPEEIGRPVRLRWRDHGDPHASDPDEPARVVRAKDTGDGTIVAAVKGRRTNKTSHRPSEADALAKTLTRNPNSDDVLVASSKHPAIDPNGQSTTIRAGGGGHSGPQPVVEGWPWDSPSTTLTADPNGRIGPPGHHGHSYLSQPNAIVLSERAAAILQGFPDGWVFAGKTKRARWAQIGMAMPPPLAEAVGRSIARWFAQMTRAA